ncbi:hypothetical protein [Nocardioides sp. LS1]|uniref:hypothetical protein n=1 Tax=Nocardioides sp. LS1 TaxID=1027620 RepID=UPI000F61DA65|nr:hypothetical protein [Nocardioides sp. LS1]GCD91853.1 hypothetical protein NLS1_38590 [Nocardioides sp. LS1]
MPVTPPVETPLPASRRGAIAALLLGSGVLAGCDLDLSGDGSGDPSASGSADPDAALVDRALAEIDDLAALVAAVSAGFPGLRGRLAPWAALHDAHREVLGDPTPSSSPAGAGSTPSFASANEALAEVRGREQRGQRRLADWAVAAESGSLARLLACMSAGVAQRLAHDLAPAGTQVPA